MSDYFRKHELCEQLKVDKSTLTNWIKYFHEYIPVMKQGDVMVYGHEALQVLGRIKELRNQLYSRQTIKRMLKDEGYSRTY